MCSEDVEYWEISAWQLAIPLQVLEEAQQCMQSSVCNECCDCSNLCFDSCTDTR